MRWKWYYDLVLSFLFAYGFTYVYNDYWELKVRGAAALIMWLPIFVGYTAGKKWILKTED